MSEVEVMETSSSPTAAPLSSDALSIPPSSSSAFVESRGDSNHQGEQQQEDELDYEDGGEEEVKLQALPTDDHQPEETAQTDGQKTAEGGEDGELPDSDDDDDDDEGHEDQTNPRKKRDKKEEEDLEEGELEDSDEEGEEGDEKNSFTGQSSGPCRFYHKGMCTWGAACRFEHTDPPGRSKKTPLVGDRPTGPIPRSEGLPPPVMGGLVALLPTPSLPPIVGGGDPLASSWERGFRSAKERVERAKERKESDVDFDDKKLNLHPASDAVDSFGRSTSLRHSQSGGYGSSSGGLLPLPLPPNVRESSSSFSRDSRRSPSPTYRRSSSSYDRHHHYSSSSSRDYPPPPTDESDYERRQRLAYMAAPRPEEWGSSSRGNDHYNSRSSRGGAVPPHAADPPINPTPGLDRYGRQIRVASRMPKESREPPSHPHEEYVDRWRRSPNPSSRPRIHSRYDKQKSDADDLSSISTSDSHSSLSDSESDGSWSSDDGTGKNRVNYKASKKSSSAPSRKRPPPPPDVFGSSSTSGMKRIPRISERSRGIREEDHPGDRPPVYFSPPRRVERGDRRPSRELDDLPVPPPRAKSHLSSPSDDFGEDRDRERSRKRSYPPIGEEDDDNLSSPRQINKRHRERSPPVSPPLSPPHYHERGSPVRSPSPESRSPPPPRKKEREPPTSKFVMDFSSKVSIWLTIEILDSNSCFSSFQSQRLQPSKAATALDRKSSDEEDDTEFNNVSSPTSKSPGSTAAYGTAVSPGSDTTGSGAGAVDKSQVKKLLEQLKEVEAKIAAKKQPNKVGGQRRK